MSIHDTVNVKEKQPETNQTLHVRITKKNNGKLITLKINLAIIN